MLVQDTVRRQQNRDAERVQREEEAKRQRLASLTSIKNLSKDEFRDMRRHLSYDRPRTARNPHFHLREQELIMVEKYGILTKNKVAPQHVMDMAHLQHPYFHDALWICKKLGLLPLMMIQQDYNIQLIHQFYSTLVFGQSDRVDFQWMTEDTLCHSDMVEFGGLLGYEFRGEEDTSLARRMHVDGYTYSKNKLEPLYVNTNDPEHFAGRAKGLKLLYNILLRIFRENIVPTSGNEDEIRGALVNLFHYSHKMFRKGMDDSSLPPIDVIHFIYKEMYLCMLDRVKAPMYAPYIMKLIMFKAPGCPLIGSNLVTHKPVKLQKKGMQSGAASGASVSRAPFASSEEEPEASEERVLDARRRPRMKHASNAPMGSGFAPTHEEMRTTTKKASIFERMLICMNIEIRKSQHQSYISERRINQNQHVLMDRVSQLLPPDQRPSPSPEPTTESEGTLSFNTWNQGSLVNWKELEEITSGPSRNTGKAPMDHDDDVYDGSGSEEEEEESD